MSDDAAGREPWSNLVRPPLSQRALRAALVRAGGWRGLEVVESTVSTNADLAERARAGEPEGLVRVAELQTGGRGRLGRGWVSPPRTGITVSVLLRPRVPSAAWGWLPLLTGLAVVRAVRQTCGLPATLKWPNDVLVPGHGGTAEQGSPGEPGSRKLAGILVEVPAPGAAVVGIGLNVSTARDELPVPTATSLLLEGSATHDRDTVLRAVLRALRSAYDGWQDDPVPVRAAYREACETLGRRVTVSLPDGTALEGDATGVDDDGRLLVWDGVRETAVGAGDVVHLRPGGG
ncbi:MAG: biotin--[acetyl-CoA-carboxylase] ligase [Actinomycetota bacterium]|nr:biotin--[acetyl-CoA-carboxylase] ligase [Actinomycetota bacterium]